MRKLVLAALVAAFALGPAIGTALADDDCKSKAVGKDGKPLAGAALTSFMTKCMKDSCDAKAIGQEREKASRRRQRQLHEEM